MKLIATIDISKIPPNPERALGGGLVQEQYIFRSTKDPKIIQLIIDELEDQA